MTSMALYLNRDISLHNYHIFGVVGHGCSDGPRCQIDTYTKYVRDAFRHIDLMKEENPNIPLYIYGHSMVSFHRLVFSCTTGSVRYSQRKFKQGENSGSTLADVWDVSKCIVLNFPGTVFKFT